MSKIEAEIKNLIFLHQPIKCEWRNSQWTFSGERLQPCLFLGSPNMVVLTSVRCKYHFQASFWQLLKSLTGGTSTILWLPLVAAAVASQISARCRNNAAAKSHQVVSGTRKYPRWRAQWRAHGLGGLNHSSCSQKSSTAVIRSCDQLTCSESRNALATSCFLHVGCSKFLSVNSIVRGERSKIRIYRFDRWVKSANTNKSLLVQVILDCWE